MSGDGQVIICEPRTECADPNANRWYCMRGHADEGKAAIPGVCPLPACERLGANTPTNTPAEGDERGKP